MKYYLKNLVAYTMALVMLVGVSATVHAEQVTFSDVPAAYWGYSTIMRMTGAGMFKGTSEPVNGVGIFMPERTMTRAEFITAVLRAVYPEATKNIQNSQGQWWRGYYNLALNCGLLYSGELDNGAMDLPMSRQEMAMVLVRGMAIKGEAPLKLISPQQIADYAVIGAHYKDYVVKCFSMGLICGIDSIGTFAPEKSLTRAEAATVLCRLVFSNDRVPVTFLNDGASDSNEGGLLKSDKTEEPSKPSKPSSGSRPTIDREDEVEDDDDEKEDANQSGNNSKPEKPNDKDETENEQFPDVTWEDFMAMDEWDQQEFMNSFESIEAFERWLEKHQDTPIIDEDMPWEDGGKQPEDYTLEEYLELNDDQKIAFRLTFESEEDFEDWLIRNMEEPDLDEDDLFAGMELEDFTLEDYIQLDSVDATAFRDKYFNSDEEFLDWMDSQIEMPELDE